MTTSLAQQLQRLAVPQTSVLKRDKKRASLLFDPKEAATLRRDTVYQIGFQGFEELKKKCSSFNQFENTLFNFTSKEFERSVQDIAANTKLNVHIKKFLLVLSPYFLLSSAHKALEWLINRYSIHEYNRDDFVMLILPYHETNIFVRALQLVEIKDNDKWIWLKSLQKPGIHLPKKVLFNHAASDSHFLQLISDFILSAVKEHENPSVLSALFNFYCMTFTAALEYSEEVNETQVSQMLKALLKGTKSKVPDFCAGSYIIIAKLVTKTELTDRILNKFVNNITKVPVSNLKTEAILLLVILYQAQKQFTEISEIAIRNIISKLWIPKLLHELNTSNNFITSFLEPLFSGCIKYAVLEVESSDCKMFLNGLMDEIQLDDDFVSHLINIILDIYEPEKEYDVAARKWLKDFICKIERQYPKMFDREVNHIMKIKPDEDMTERQKCFEKLLTKNLSLEGNIAVFEKLYHSLPEVRKSTMKHLIKKYGNMKEREKEFFENAILDRLNDDNCSVVRETLNSCNTILPKLSNINTVTNILIKLLGKCYAYKDEWRKVFYPAVTTLCSIANYDDLNVFLSILPFLLPTEQSEVKVAKAIIDSSYSIKCKFLKSIKEQLENETSYEKVFMVVFDSLGKGLNKPDISVLLNTLKDASQKNKGALHNYLSTVLLCNSLSETCSPDVSSLVLDIVIIYLGSSNLAVVKTESTPISYILKARKNMLPLQGCLHCIEDLVLKTQVPKIRLGLFDFSESNETSKFFSVLLDILLRGCYVDNQKISLVYARTLNKCFEHFFTNFKDKIEFFLNISVANSKFIHSALQLRCIHTVSSLLSKKQQNISLFVNLNEVIVPYALICLSSPHNEIRLCALDIIHVLSVLDSVGKNNYTVLLQHILKYKEEIIMDQDQISLVLYNILTTKEIKGNVTTFKRILKSLIDVAVHENYPAYLKSGVLILLRYIDDFETYERISKVAVDILEQNKFRKVEFNIHNSLIVYNNIIRFNSQVVSRIKLDSNIFRFVELALRNDMSIVRYNNDQMSNPCIILMDKIVREIFDGLSSDVKTVLLNIVIEVATVTQNPEVSSSAGRVFKHIDLDANLVVNQLIKMRDVESPKINATKRKRRVSVIPAADILDTLEWKKGVTVLEFIQDKKKIKSTEVLLPVLFDILKKCLDFDEQASVEYTKQLILSSILNSCGKVGDASLPENVYNMESVVQCIRASQNPQTHHHALLVLAHTAYLIPRQVLHHIMAIFTFMGSSVLRHDDAYSFQIINKIIDTIIPILVEDNSIDNIVNVLRVFVDVILDVPEHRRLTLYKHLLSCIGVKENLHYFLLLVFEAHVLHANVDKLKNKSEESNSKQIIAPKRLDIAATLSCEFPPDVVIVSCKKLAEYIRKLPENKEDSMDDDFFCLFDIKHHTPKQFRHYKYIIVTFINNLLSSKEFIDQLVSLPDDKLLELEPLHKELIINVLSYIQTVSKNSEKNANTPQAQYWKVMLHHIYDILDSINALLTPQMFLLVIRGLSTHNLNAIRRRALELLNSKLQHHPFFFNNCDDTELFALLPSLLNIIKQVEMNEIDSEQEIIIQTALLSLKLFIKLLAKNSPEKFLHLLEFLTNLIKSGKIHGNILASTVLCIAELCSNLRAHAISSLPKLMPSIIKILKSHKHQEVPDLLLLSAVTAIQKIISSLPLFLSPYLEKLLCELSTLTSKLQSQKEDPKFAPFITKLVSIKQQIGSSIPARVLIPIIAQGYSSLVEKRKFSGIGPLMDILAENISNLKGSEIQANLPELQIFFLYALQFRTDSMTSYEETIEVETHIIKALVNLILKLSETSFRPLYYKFYDWAVRNDVKNERVITFYSLSSEIANSLKGLFVLFAGHFLNNAASILDGCNAIKGEDLYFKEDYKNIILIENILKTLHSVFLYDSQKFVNKERFDVLMQPIVDQLENNLGGTDLLVNRAKTLIIPCVVQLSVASGDDSLWKQLNYQILLKMRHTSSHIRLIALECLTEMAKKLGEDFLPLLPETIPFLAELLEDEDENVEKCCQKTVQELEKVLGEPLQKYF